MSRNSMTLLRALSAQPWALEPDKLRVLAEFLVGRFQGTLAAPAPDTLAAMRADTARASSSTRNGVVAVLPVRGVIAHRMNYLEAASGGTSIELLGADFDAAMADSTVRAIVLDVDSPGGSTDGVPELAARILAARAASGGKKVVAVANTLMASAAYWLAASADEIVASPSAIVGSIGVYAVHVDESQALADDGLVCTTISAGKFKTETTSYAPLSDDAKSALQATVDEFYGMFVTAVAKGRGVPESAVRNGYGQGRAVAARDALAQNLVDRVATLADTVTRLNTIHDPKSRTRAPDTARRALLLLDD